MGLGLYRTRLRLGWNSLSKAFERNQTLVGNTLAIIFGVPFLSFLPSGVRWGVPIAMVMFTIYRVLKEYRIIRNSLTTPHIPLIVIVGKEKHVREEIEREVREILSPLGFRRRTMSAGGSCPVKTTSSIKMMTCPERCKNGRLWSRNFARLWTTSNLG
ncbi:hypothetical protein Tter_2388 [Thermobaculum terrenum ATCC BAA-798]|uniref:Uncharacterized protein n=1 Tax=Thermobaculum terrenum (strain ATCC BAA-798 / CCMEE 7001 / YNP1) TaxID=525904 RepID=D1CHR4_THET1|nr:hypothetical protein [Thermobaculum terrenum]ACZ43285.1 hypothetical protein Tter_2388 [Thermobaculum terrenum ATCC BAA-798]